VATERCTITVVGLGPGHPGHLTVNAMAHLKKSVADRTLVLRTRIHPTVEAIEWLRDTPSYDHVYEQAPDFDTVYKTIVADLLARAAGGSVTYAVPGHPAIGESTVARLRLQAAQSKLSVEIVPGLSFIDAIAPVVDVDIADGARIADALALGTVNPTVPLLVCQMHSRRAAASLKLDLGQHYPDDHLIKVIRAAGAGQLNDVSISTIPLWQLDRHDFVDHLTSVWVPALPILEASREPASLLAVMARLRGPDGCPWDREQTHESLRRFLLEETYEALEALDSGDAFALEEELGDLLLQIVFHAQIGAEQGTFNFGDVVATITGKMIRRHPHVFGDASAATTDEVLSTWEATKRAEREATSVVNADRTSMLDGVPKALPALAQAQAVQERAARVGFDWPNVQGVLDKLIEEARELAEARSEGLADELGDVLFVTVNLARHLGVDAEEALRGATAKFRRRFGYVEQAVTSRGLDWTSLNLASLDTLWDEAKAATDASPDRRTATAE
jgi:tetrapyrrole methylase family protein/MazG family protein